MASVLLACALLRVAGLADAAAVASGTAEAARYSNPSVWGPPSWFFLHSVTLALPESVPSIMQAGLKSLVVGMRQVLPCKACREHLSAHLWLQQPLEEGAATREGAIHWMINLHNAVNEGLGKQVLSSKEVLQAYAAAYPGQAANYSDPRIWGPATWFFLHSVTLALPKDVPPDTKVGFRQLLTGMWQVLPCEACQRRLGERLLRWPLELNAATREGAIQWMIDFHNEVNKDLGKKVLSHEEVLQTYEAAYSSTSERRKVYKDILKPRPSRYLKSFAVIGFLGVAVGTGAFWFELKKHQGRGGNVYDVFALRSCLSVRKADEEGP